MLLSANFGVVLFAPAGGDSRQMFFVANFDVEPTDCIFLCSLDVRDGNGCLPVDCISRGCVTGILLARSVPPAMFVASGSMVARGASSAGSLSSEAFRLFGGKAG